MEIASVTKTLLINLNWYFVYFCLLRRYLLAWKEKFVSITFLNIVLCFSTKVIANFDLFLIFGNYWN